MELVDLEVDFNNCGGSDLAAYVASKGGDVSSYLPGSCEDQFSPIHWRGYGPVPSVKPPSLENDFDMSPYVGNNVVIQSFEGDRYLWAENDSDIRAVKLNSVSTKAIWKISTPASYPDGFNASSNCYTIERDNKLLYALKTYSFRDGLRIFSEGSFSDEFEYYKEDFLWRFDHAYCDNTEQRMCHFIVNCASKRALFAIGHKNTREGFGANVEPDFYPKQMWTMTLV